MIRACCGKSSVVLTTDRPIDKSLIDFLVLHNFVEHAHFTIAGILYTDSPALIISGPIGSDKLSVKCKRDSCNKEIEELENLLIQF